MVELKYIRQSAVWYGNVFVILQVENVMWISAPGRKGTLASFASVGGLKYRKNR